MEQGHQERLQTKGDSLSYHDAEKSSSPYAVSITLLFNVMLWQDIGTVDLKEIFKFTSPHLKLHIEA